MAAYHGKNDLMITLAYLVLALSFFVFSIRVTAFAAILSGQNKPNFNSWVPDIAIAICVPLTIWSLKTIFA